MDRSEFIDDATWQRYLEVSETLETPFILINLNKIKENYESITTNFPDSMIYYAVKANPHPEVISLLKDLGSNFDIASRYELDRVLGLGVNPAKLSYGNTIKKARDVEYFYEKGVRMFCTDSRDDLKNIAQYAPGSKVYVRILIENSVTADWPLSRKFGCHPDHAYDIVVLAKSLGLIPYGISFHVGSQQRDIGAWDDALVRVSHLVTTLEEEEDIHLDMINMGGGFPAHYIQPTNELDVYGSEINRYIDQYFGKKMQIILEPGRSMVGDAGILVSEVVLVSRKNNTALHRWVYIDSGKFNGLIETLDEAIKYPIVTSKDGPGVKTGEVVISGCTCDSCDILYENFKYKLPLALKSGDRMYFLSAGAYTATYASVEFNGFPPIRTFILPLVNEAKVPAMAEAEK